MYWFLNAEFLSCKLAVKLYTGEHCITKTIEKFYAKIKHLSSQG